MRGKRARKKPVRPAAVLAIAGVVTASVAAVVAVGLTQNRPAHPRATPSAVRATAAAIATRPGPVATVTARAGGQALSALTPVQVYNVSGVHGGSVRLGVVTYTDSVRFTCDSGSHGSSGDLDYPVSGYGSMSALAAVPGDDASAAGDVMTVSFFNNGAGAQTSGPFTITPGHPLRVRIRLQGASQLEISCSAVDAATQSPRYMDLALANATLARG